MARPSGFEPETDGLEVRCSIHLSYGRIIGGLPASLANFWTGRALAQLARWRGASIRSLPLQELRGSPNIGNLYRPRASLHRRRLSIYRPCKLRRTARSLMNDPHGLLSILSFSFGLAG